MEKNELKFRVWNGSEMEHNIMVGKFGIFYVNPSNNGIDENDTASLSPFNTKYPDDIPLMRFTGLIDKNGKEIWEGDIINIWLSDEIILTNPIEFVWGAFSIDIDYDGYKTALFDYEDDDKKYIYEVVGNVYENPEILNGLEETEAGGEN